MMLMMLVMVGSIVRVLIAVTMVHFDLHNAQVVRQLAGDHTRPLLQRHAHRDSHDANVIM